MSTPAGSCTVQGTFKELGRICRDTAGVVLARVHTAQDIEELGVGLLGLARQAGGFPHVAHNGALVSASGTTVIAPPAGQGGMPGEMGGCCCTGSGCSVWSAGSLV